MRRILPVLFLIVPGVSFAQTDFRKGFIITNSQDTIQGLVNYRENYMVHVTCEFKESKDNEKTVYKTDQLAGYGFEDDKFYETRQIVRRNGTTETVFLEVIVRGTITLYKYNSTFWVEKERTGLQELYNEAKETYIDDKLVLKKMNQHVGTLNMLMVDCAEIRPLLQKKIGLAERSLTNLVLTYNQCKGKGAKVFKEKRPWTKSTFGVISGVQVSRLDLKSTNGVWWEYLSRSSELSISPFIGLSFDFLFPRINEYFSFNGSVSFSSSKYELYHEHESPPYSFKDYVTIEIQQLKIPLGFRYTFPEKKFTPFIGMGYAATLHLNSNSTWVQERETNGVVVTSKNETFEIKSNQNGFWASLGIKTSISKKLNASVELMVEKTDGIVSPSSDYEGLKSNITNFHVLVRIGTK